MERSKLNINKERLERNLYELGKIGRNEHGGIDRALGSKEDLLAREWLRAYWEGKMGLKVRHDAIANMWVLYDSRLQENTIGMTSENTKENTTGMTSENTTKNTKESSSGEYNPLPPIVIGSHHDAVPDGGMYDGALGVLGATEIVETLMEAGVKLNHPIEIVSFTGEEPNPYNVSTLGSKVLSGRLVREDLEKLTSYIDGSPLSECISAAGGDIERAEEALIKPGEIDSFIELHIEQGRRLFDRGLTSASVNCITGIYRENITVHGEANHAGTTVMGNRHDAFLAAGEFALGYEKIIKEEHRDDVVGTIGYVKVSPNAASIIPGSVELILELRCCSEEIRQRVKAKVYVLTEEIDEKRGVTIERKLNLDQKEMPMDPEVIAAIDQGIAIMGQEPVTLVSMAGHDAANMARVTRSAMIFVQSINGKSHCPEEDTDIDRIEETVNAMLQAVLILDEK